jgi:phage recombination protein Bet
MVTNAITKYMTDHGEVQISPSIIRAYLVNGNGAVTDQEVQMFLNLCLYQKLNPFLREAYLIKFGTSPATIVTGKEVFTKRASKRADFDGFNAGIIVIVDKKPVYRDGSMVFDGEVLVGGWAEVGLKDKKNPIRAEVSMKEYCQMKDGGPMANWKKIPATMIRKVALVQALREAYPEDFQGMYTPEEMPVDDSRLPDKTIDVEVLPPMATELGGDDEAVFDAVLEQAEATNANPSTVELKCSTDGCSEKMTQKVYDYSIKKFGKSLCYGCQKKPQSNILDVDKLKFE